MKRILLILLTPTIVLLLLWGLIDGVLLPRVSEWAKAEVETWTAANAPVTVRIEKLKLRLVTPSAEVEGIEVVPKDALSKTLGPVRVEKMYLRLDLFEIFLGRAEIAAIVAEGIEGALNLDPLMESKEPAKALPLKEIFQWAERIPIRRVVVTDSRLFAQSDELKVKVDLRLRSLVLVNRPNRLSLDVTSPDIQIEYDQLGRINVGATLAAELTPSELVLQDLRLRRGDLSLHIEGRSDDPAQLPLKPRLRLRADTVVPLQLLAEEIMNFRPKLKLPAMAGALEASTELRLEGSTTFESRVSVRTKGIKVGSLDIGDASLDGRLSKDSLLIDRIGISHPAGTAELSGSKLDFHPPYAFRTEIDVKKLDMQALFQSIGLKQIPVDAVLAGKIPCEGEISPLRVTCTPHATSERIHVKSDNKNGAPTIVSVRDAEAQGSATITDKEVSFESKLRIGSSRGDVSGKVGYKTGFAIKVKTPQVFFKDVENLANLKFEGSAMIEGTTEGDSDTAIFDLKLNVKDFIFENYELGQVDGDLRFRKGHLLFENLHQSLGRTRMQGKLDLDLNEPSAVSGEFRSESVDAADIAQVFSRIWKMPLDVQASGKARMSFSGPLNFWKLNYHVEGEFDHGTIQGDSFDSLILQATAVEGNLNLDKVELTKNQSLVKATGGISSQQQLKLLVDANGLRLEESEMVNRVRSNIAGQLNVACEITGSVDNPEVKARGSLSDFMIEEQEVPGSFFQMRLTKDFMQGETNLFGNRIQGEVQIPYREGNGPLRVRLKTTDWAFTEVLSLFGASTLQNEYESNLTADIDLHSDVGRFDRMSGKVTLKTLSMKRAALNLKNPQPIDFIFDDGLISLKNAVLEGSGDASIRLRGENFRADRLNLSINADSDLRLLHLLLPFLDDLGGPFKLEATVTGSLLKPEILGNASLKDAFFKLKGFPHPIEKMGAEIIFSHSRVLVQGLQGQLAGGHFEGEGSAQINGMGDVPTQLRIRAQGLNLNVPDKVHSQGNADLIFSGKWFPFVLSGRYQVNSALVEMEFGGGESGSSTSVRTSNYLPKVLRESQFEPVLLDLQIPLERNIVIRNSLMEGSVTGQLQVKGPPQSPILLGRISMERNSKIMIKDKPFEVISGNVNFNNFDEINPEVYLSAQSRVNDYDVNVIVQGPAKSFNIRMTSTPPLTEQDIISLLALGITSEKQETSQSRQQAEQLGYEAIGIGLSKTGFQKGVQKNLGVDVQITSAYDSTKNISVPKLTLSRKLTERLNATYARPMNSEQNEFKLTYKINNNVSAIGSYEETDPQDSSVIRDSTRVKESIFGLDLEFKREFK